jgi:predicted Zn-dependent peptidase
MERARRYLTTAEARADATNSSRCAGLSTALVDGRPLRSYEERVARLDAVTPAQIQSLARRLFAGRHFAIVTLY